MALGFPPRVLTPYKNGAADRAGIAREIPLPKCVTDDNNGWAAIAIFLKRKLAAGFGGDAEGMKQSGGNALLAYQDSVSVHSKVDAGNGCTIERDFESGNAVPDELPGITVEIGLKEITMRVQPDDLDEAASVRIREWLDHGRVHDGEHGRVRADAQGEDEGHR